MPIKLISDIPWGEFRSANSTSPGLGFDIYSEVLSQVILGTDGPFTIGVFGPWGCGKTSLLRAIKNEIEKEAEKSTEVSTVTVWFNAWQYERDEDMLTALLATVAADIEQNATRLKKLNKSLSAGLGTIKRYVKAAVAASSVKIEGSDPTATFGKIGFDASGEKFVKELEKKADPIIAKTKYFKLFEQYGVTGSAAKKDKVVVFIDDLDRCTPDSALAVLQYIKLVLHQRQFMFVIGLDESVIVSYLEKKFEKDFAIKNFRSREYLQKIVTLPFEIPPYTERFDAFVTGLIGQLKHLQLSKEDSDSLITVANLWSKTCDYNPRSVIRFLNGLVVAYEILKSSFKDESARPSLQDLGVSLALTPWKVLRDLINKTTNDLEIVFDNFIKNRKGIDSWEELQKALGCKEDMREILSNEDNGNLRELLLSKAGRSFLKSENRKAMSQYLATLNPKTSLSDMDAASNFERGKALSRQGRYEEAGQAYDAALKIQRDYHEALNNKGINLAKLEQYDKAIAAFDTALMIKPEDLFVLYNKGKALAALGQHVQAIAAYDTVLKIKPDDHESLNNKGASLFALGRWDEAEEAVLRAIELQKQAGVSTELSEELLAEIRRRRGEK